MSHTRHGTGDPELDDLFTDPADRLLAKRLRSVQRAFPEPDPAFEAQLLAEAREMKERQLPWHRRMLDRLARPRLAVVGAVAAALLLALAATVLANRDGQKVNVASPLDHAHAVSVAKPITLAFNQPMEAASTERAVRIEPSTPVSYRWTSPRTLEITPQQGQLEPDTRYQVTVQTTARTQDQRPLSQPVTISFVTVGTTPTPAATPAPTAAPSPTATAGPSPSPSPSPSASPSVSPSPSLSPSPAPSASPAPSPSPSPGR